MKALEGWKIKKAVTVCGQYREVNSEFRDRLSRRQWDVGHITRNVRSALADIRAGKASLIILDDSPALPLSVMLRQVTADMTGLMTPVMGLCNETNPKEKTCINSMSTARILDQPVSPLKFVEAFEQTLMAWTAGPLKHIHKAGSHYRDGNVKSAVQILAEVSQRSEDPQASMLANPILAMALRASSLKSAEKILLASLKRGPRNMAVIFALVDLYLNGAMPGAAIRLLNGAQNAYKEPKALYLDQIQAYSMLNMGARAIEILRKMLANDFMADFAAKVLPRYLFGAGYHAEIPKFLRTMNVTPEAFKAAWSRESGQRKAG